MMKKDYKDYKDVEKWEPSFTIGGVYVVLISTKKV
jgi:hypothetical protein